MQYQFFCKKEAFKYERFINGCNQKWDKVTYSSQKNIDYINVKGLDVIRQHAQDFIAKREAPAFIPNDGKQTPTQGCTMSSGHRLCTDRSGA